jgi:hypothetical protein
MCATLGLTQAQRHDAGNEQAHGDLQLGVAYVVEEAVCEGLGATGDELAHAHQDGAWHHQHHHGTCSQREIYRVGIKT